MGNYNGGALDGNQSSGEQTSIGAGGTSTSGPVSGGTIEGGIGKANQILLQGAAAGSPPQVVAQGSDANIDIDLVAKGSGTLNIATPQLSTTATAGAIVGPVDVVGYLEIKLGGTTYKIPYFGV